MSGSADNDILVFFQKSAGSDKIKGESTSALTEEDSAMTTGFETGFYSEAEHFSFKIQLNDDESGQAGKDDGSFARWRAITDTTSTPKPPFRAEAQDVTFRRMIDVSSPILLEFCLDGKPFANVTMIKRARRGTDGKLAVILRMEFTKVWIQAIDWDDGDTVTETCTFKFLSFKAKYAKFRPDGRPDSTVECNWDGKMARNNG